MEDYKGKYPRILHPLLPNTPPPCADHSFLLRESRTELGLVALTFNPSMRRQRQVDLRESEAGLLYLVPGQLGLHSETLSETNKQKIGTV